MLTGIGGQGVQLAGQVLARAATLEGRCVTLFGVYSGVMRGGNTDATVVVADGPIEAPPIVSRTWSVIAMHHEFWEPLAPRLRPGGLAVINSTVFEADHGLDPETYRVVEVPATEAAAELGNLMAASMVVLGAYASVTGIVGLDATLEAMAESIPPYRRQHLPLNEAALRAGWGMVEPMTAPAWAATSEEVPA
jgi:2-oxoglutarate ferredoxin oxidoreductase subunit gamma